MFYLDKLKNGRLYSNIKVSALAKTKDTRRKNLIYFSGNHEDDIIQFINSGILNPSFFRGVYTQRIFQTVRLNKRVTFNRKEYYEKINASCNNITYTKKSLDAYKDLNLLYDITSEYLISEKEIKIRGKARINSYVDFIIKKIAEGATYTERAIAIPVPNDIADNSYFGLSKISNPFSYIYTAFKKNLLSEDQKKALIGTTFIFYTTSKNSFVKFTVDENFDMTEINKLIRSLNSMVKIANKQSLDTTVDETPIEEKELASDSELKAEVVLSKQVEEYKRKLLKPLNIENNSKTIPEVIQWSDTIEDIIRETLVSNKSETPIPEKEVLALLDKNVKLKQGLNEIKEFQKIGKEINLYNKKLDILRDKQSEVNFEEIHIDDIIKDFSSTSIDTELIENTTIIQPEAKKSNLKDFDASYGKKQLKKDLVSVISAFNNDNDVKLFVTNIASENTSDELTKKMTYTVNFQDDRNVKHTIKFDYPLVQDGRFMNINGGKKLILKQILLLPIVKTKPDTVQITTNYNKFFIMRFGAKLTQKIEKLKKFFGGDLTDFYLDKVKFKYKLGNSVSINKNYETTLEYNEISSFLLELETSNLHVYFNHEDVKKFLEDDLTNVKKLSSITYDKNNFLVFGFNADKSKLIAVSFEDKRVYLLGNNTSEVYFDTISALLMDSIRNGLSEEASQKVSSFANAKTLTYNRIKINNKMIPLAVLLGYEIGLSSILSRYNVSYTFSTKNVKLGIDEDRSKIKFKDGYMYYDTTKLRNSLLLDGLNTMATEEFTFAEFDTIEPYIENFFDVYGSRNVGKGFHNTLSLMIDPITLDVLKQLKLPENIYDILLYANTMLEDTSYKRLNDMESYRIRGAEQVNSYLYKILADTFKTYKDTMKAGNPIKMSIAQDALLKALVTSPTVDEYSTLSPSLEIEKSGASTYKGLAGINLDNAYTTEIRSYDPTMTGIFSLSTPDSAKVGVVRQLSYDPGIINTRGFLDTNRSTKNGSTNIYGAAELLNPFTSTHADPPRIGMQTTQQKHIIPVKLQSKPLFGSGVEKSLAYMLTDDFVFRSKKSGKLKSVDSENEVAVLEYDDGTMDIIDLSEILSKNSNGGLSKAHIKFL